MNPQLPPPLLVKELWQQRHHQQLIKQVQLNRKSNQHKKKTQDL